MMRNTFGDEALMEAAGDMDGEERLEIFERHPNQCRGMMLTNVDEDYDD
jgi:hypothetical protein